MEGLASSGDRKRDGGTSGWGGRVGRKDRRMDGGMEGQQVGGWMKD